MKNTAKTTVREGKQSSDNTCSDSCGGTAVFARESRYRTTSISLALTPQHWQWLPYPWYSRGFSHPRAGFSLITDKK